MRIVGIGCADAVWISTADLAERKNKREELVNGLALPACF